jgi:hypothetical protein
MNQAKLLFTFLLAVLGMAAFGQDNKNGSCDILRNGKFKYIGGEDTTAYVVIHNTSHIEYFNKGKYYIKSELYWVNGCEYNMTMTETTVPEFPYHPGDVMNVKVNKIANDTVYYTSTVNGEQWNGRFLVVK